MALVLADGVVDVAHAGNGRAAAAGPRGVRAAVQIPAPGVSTDTSSTTEGRGHWRHRRGFAFALAVHDGMHQQRTTRPEKGRATRIQT